MYGDTSVDSYLKWDAQFPDTLYSDLKPRSLSLKFSRFGKHTSRPIFCLSRVNHYQSNMPFRKLTPQSLSRVP